MLFQINKLWFVQTASRAKIRRKSANFRENFRLLGNFCEICENFKGKKKAVTKITIIHR